LSRVMIERNRVNAEKKGLSSVYLYNLAADEIDRLQQTDFDIIIMNSVIQCFPGYNYLRKVIRKCIGIMSESGTIFLGDVMDLELKDDLIASIKLHKQLYPEANAKLDNSAETYYAKNFFVDLQSEFPEIARVCCNSKHHTIVNELTQFRYDVQLFVDKKGKSLIPPKKKAQHGIDIREEII